MSGWYFHYSLLTAIIAVAAFAWIKGGTPERIGATLNLLGSVLFSGLQTIMVPEALALSLLVLDGLFGVAFLILAVRYASLWLGAAMLLQAAQFSLHAFYYVTAKPVDRLFAIVNNLVSWGILLSIVVGVIGHWLNVRHQAPAA